VAPVRTYYELDDSRKEWMSLRCTYHNLSIAWTTLQTIESILQICILNNVFKGTVLLDKAEHEFRLILCFGHFSMSTVNDVF